MTQEDRDFLLTEPGWDEFYSYLETLENLGGREERTQELEETWATMGLIGL